MAVDLGSTTGQTPSRRRERHLVSDFVSIMGFGIFVALWIAFGYALIVSQGSLDRTYEWLQGLPLIAQMVVVLLTLPVAVALWIWETSWPLIVRLPLVIAIAASNLAAFFPRALIGR